MKLLVNKAHYPVTVLGPGRRIGIWLQGCSIRCRGCVSQDTWPADPGRALPVARLVAWCRAISGGQLDGVTISGGEPFDQPRGLAALLDRLADWRREAGLDFDILCYSGHPLATLRARHGALLDRLDAVIPEPYIEAQPPAHLWRGSRNQTLVPCSARGAARYAPWLEAPLDDAPRRLQLSVENGRAWLIGIPARGDLAAAEALCAARGIRLDDVSWRR